MLYTRRNLTLDELRAKVAAVGLATAAGLLRVSEAQLRAWAYPKAESSLERAMLACAGDEPATALELADRAAERGLLVIGDQEARDTLEALVSRGLLSLARPGRSGAPALVVLSAAGRAARGAV